MQARASVWLATIIVTLSVAYPLVTLAQRRAREEAAAERVSELVRAQHAFRDSGGRGFYASTLDSLNTPCPQSVGQDRAPASQEARTVAGRGQAPSQELRTWPRRGQAPLQELRSAVGGYLFEVRAAADARVAGTDCHGRPTTDAFLATATPARVGEDGLRAFTAGADGRIYVFFDGVAPDERTIASGLAMPVDGMAAIP